MKSSKTKKTQLDYAQEYRVETRTIRNWIAKGYPLDDPEKVAQLVADQKNSNRSRAEASAVTVDATTLTDEQLGNPPSLAHAKLYQLILVCRRLAFANAKERDLYALKSDVIERMQYLTRNLAQEIRTIFERDLPPLQAGLDAAFIQKQNADAIHRLFSEYQARSRANGIA